MIEYWTDFFNWFWHCESLEALLIITLPYLFLMIVLTPALLFGDFVGWIFEEIC